MTKEPIGGGKQIACPKCDSLVLYRFGHVRSGLQRYMCRMCGREFIPGHERIFPLARPTCGRCGAGMHLFKKKGASTVFRCGRYPACRTYARVKTPPVLKNVAKPLAKEAIRGGIVACRKGRKLVADASEGIEDIVAEVKTEPQHHGSQRSMKPCEVLGSPAIS